ncbi:MAG: hypothetical protein JWM53_272 [bacterium]|nr:hypothetical protein [bacterium]
MLGFSNMSKDYKCPACQNNVDRAATVCSNPVCRAELAFCSHCFDITTYTLAEKGEGRFQRDKFKCGRCERVGVKCLNWLAGGYCNGLARATDGKLGKPLCANCNSRVGEVGRTVIGWSLVGAFGGLLKPRK